VVQKRLQAKTNNSILIKQKKNKKSLGLCKSGVKYSKSGATTKKNSNCVIILPNTKTELSLSMYFPSEIRIKLFKIAMKLGAISEPQQ